MVSLSSQNPFSVTSRLVEAGAILTLPGVPLVRHLVVDVQWLSDREAAFVTLGDDLRARAAYVRFDRLAVHSFGIALERGDDVVAVLTSFDKAACPTPEDYQALWDRWRACGAPIPETFPDGDEGRLSSSPKGRWSPLATSL